MPLKAFRDPVHDHIYLDKDQDKLILELISCPEVQRLRRIRQLGVSSFTYPGAEHSRFGHALGACHLMAAALRATRSNQPRFRILERTRLAALAAALLHDIGHGPFSHVLERQLFPDVPHDQWTTKLIANPQSIVNQVLRAKDASLPDAVVRLIEGRPPASQSWLSCLVCSQLDVDRMDYLLRDSHFCGVGYGRYEVERILHTMRISRVPPVHVKQPVWLEKGRTAIEEYIFARYYMYWNVYYHRTTRGYEELLKAIFRRASQVAKSDRKKFGACSDALMSALLGEEPTMEKFLGLDDHVVCFHILTWRNSKDKTLSDLSRRFLDRDGLKPIELRRPGLEFAESRDKARRYIEARGFDPDFYFLTNEAVTSAYDYYHAEDDTSERSAKTSILLQVEKPSGGRPSFCEISRVSPRLKGMTGTEEERAFCYVPEECRDRVTDILGGA